ncbi:hypothetical protein AeMF1_006007 [Aphanomyces euteiches]|nr:hypothetical protein AeMF1_006007 [Aphanomyces euteiches]
MPFLNYPCWLVLAILHFTLVASQSTDESGLWNASSTDGSNQTNTSSIVLNSTDLIDVPTTTPADPNAFLDIESIDYSTLILFNTSAYIALYNVSLRATDSFEIELSLSPVNATNVTLSIDDIPTYPTTHNSSILSDNFSWTLEQPELSGQPTLSRVIETFLLDFQVPPSFYGSIEFSLKLIANSSVSLVYHDNITWLPPDLALPTLHEDINQPVDIVSMDINTSIPFGTAGLIRLDNISLGVTDQLQVKVRVSDPLASSVTITLLAVESIETYPTEYWPVVLENGTWILPHKDLSTYQNVSRNIDSLTVAFQLGHFFVGTMQYALRVSVLKENNQDFQWTREGDMTWLPPDLSIPLLYEDVDVPIDIASVEFNTFAPYNTTALIRLNNISLGVSDQLQVEVSVSDPLASNVIMTLFAVERMENYPPAYWPMLLDDGTWTLPGKALSADQNESRMIDSLTVAFQLGQFFVGTMEYSLRLSVVKENNQDFQWTREGDMTWLPPDLSIPPLHKDVDVPIDIASVDMNSSVQFNTTALIRLNNISLGITDQLQVEIRVSDPLASNVIITLLAVESMETYPSEQSSVGGSKCVAYG